MDPTFGILEGGRAALHPSGRQLFTRDQPSRQQLDKVS
jgi:hypothetical protein